MAQMRSSMADLPLDATRVFAAAVQGEPGTTLFLDSMRPSAVGDLARARLLEKGKVDIFYTCIVPNDASAPEVCELTPALVRRSWKAYSDAVANVGAKGAARASRMLWDKWAGGPVLMLRSQRQALEEQLRRTVPRPSVEDVPFRMRPAPLTFRTDAEAQEVYELLNGFFRAVAEDASCVEQMPCQW
jgi:hypothetical protein